MDVYVRHALIAIALFLVASGCRGTDSSIELLESELRWMEDQIYTMDRELAHAQAKLDSAQRYNESLQKELADATDNGTSQNRPTPADNRPSIGSDLYDESDLVIPEIDLGTNEEEPDLDTGDATGESLEGLPSNTPAESTESTEGFQVPDDSEILPNQPAPSDDATTPSEDVDLELEEITRGEGGEVRSQDIRVERIVLNSRLSGGYNFDGKPGDDGLLLVIEPQNMAGQYLPLPGNLTITVEDPRRSGPEGRVARWEFNAIETVGHMKKTLLGRGIHLTLPWPAQPPNQTSLKVIASYRAADGRNLNASRNVRVDTGVPRDVIVDGKSSAPFGTRLLPERSQRRESSLSQVPAPPRAPSTQLSPGSNKSRVAHQPWQASRPEKRTGARKTRTPSGSARQSQSSWRPYR